MARTLFYDSSALFIIFLVATVLIPFLKPASHAVKPSAILIGTGNDVKQYPGRNSSLPRRSRSTTLPPCLKLEVGMQLTNTLLCASCIVLLAGDVAANPGPAKDPCAVCSKGCRANQRAVQCDECDSWFQGKCIGMTNVEYERLCDPSTNWSCLKCLFPGADSPAKDTGIMVYRLSSGYTHYQTI